MNSKTKRALAWLAEGHMRKDMAVELGLTGEECRQLISNMQRSGYIAKAYVLTDKGQQRAEHIPKSDPKELAQWRDYYYRTKPLTADKSVELAKRSVPNSVFALGAM